MHYVVNEETSVVWNGIYLNDFVYKKQFCQKPITDKSFQNKCQAEYFILWHDNVVSDL
jgi:hypothetical protein